MDNLPDPANSSPGLTPNPPTSDRGGIKQTPSADNQNQPVTPQKTGSIGISKEVESGIGPVSETANLTEIGKDKDLPKEVTAVGVKLTPTVVQIPQPITAAGVQPAGTNVTLGSGTSVSLPLTDDQIAGGLKQSVASSWRWLAEWCKRRLKQLHIVLKTIGGKTVEVKQT